MIEAMTWVTAIVCAAMCLRLMAFRRTNARYRLGISLMAWVLAAATSMVTPFSAILFLMRVWLAFIYPASEWGYG
ncbi:phage holin family protein, partial [Pseudomonas sp. NPDC086251]|uniref:phage holin family protein n=1 Tax=Pseudomonas sp. NPDC086251 TaxID=3364431 RepID=UPI0038325116